MSEEYDNRTGVWSALRMRQVRGSWHTAAAGIALKEAFTMKESIEPAHVSDRSLLLDHRVYMIGALVLVIEVVRTWVGYCAAWAGS